MKLNFIFILLILTSCFHTDSYTQTRKKTASKNPLIGKWETLPNRLESSRLTLEFKKNSDFKYDLTSNWGGRYKLNGTNLISNYYIPILNKNKADSSTVLIYSDTLIQVMKVKGNNQTLKMVRENKAERGAGIIGTWIVLNPDVQKMTITYNTDGTFKIHNILKSFNAKYVIKGKTFIVVKDGREIMLSEFEFMRGELMLYSKKSNGPIRMIRAKD